MQQLRKGKGGAADDNNNGEVTVERLFGSDVHNGNYVNKKKMWMLFSGIEFILRFKHYVGSKFSLGCVKQNQGV